MYTTLQYLLYKLPQVPYPFVLFVGSNLKKIDVSVRAAACGTASGMKLATARQERGCAPMSRALCICRGANDARRRSLLRDAKPHNRWRPYAVAAGGVVEWKVRLARGLEAATWGELIDRVLVVVSTPFLTPRARVHV